MCDYSIKVSDGSQQTLMVAAQRVGIQLPRARLPSLLNPYDLVREAVGWNDMFGHIVV